MEENKKPLAEGEEKEEAVSKNFIEREIDKDLAAVSYTHLGNWEDRRHFLFL